MIKFSRKLKISNEEKEYIKKCLPPEWETDVKEVYVEKNFEIFFRINAKTTTEIQDWVSRYQKVTNTSYSVETTHKCSGQRVIFKRSYHCQHKTRHKHTYDPVYHRSIRNTNCPSIISIAIRTIKKRYQGKDKSKAPDENKPCEVRLRLKHNHSTTNSMALKFKKVLPEVKSELLKLFQQGHTAATALQTIKADIQLNNENIDELLADRSRCPDYGFCHYLYQKFLSENEIEFNNQFLQNKLEEYNKNYEDASRIILTETGYIICLCPPLVRRIHQYQKNSSEIVFLDSFSTCDKSSRIFILITQSESGGLPLGVIITSSNSNQEIRLGLNLLQEMLGEIAFFSNLEGPDILLSDEYIVDNQIFSDIWPKTVNLLSTFHVLQNIWKWLQSAKNNIANSDRPILFKDFYNMLYAQNTEDYFSKYEIAKQNSIKYKHYLKHLNTYFAKRHLWAICFRPNLSYTYSQNTYSEIVMRVFRDKIFHRLKSFNLVQMLDFIINNFFRYFERQLLDVAFNREVGNIFYGKSQLPTEEILNKIQILNKNVRLVPSEKVKDLFYMVNTDLLTCTCFNGNSNDICKHIQWVSMLVYSDELSKSVKNIEVIKKCYLIATGSELYTPDETADEAVQPTVNNEMFEDMYVSMENSDIVDIDQYLIMKKKNDCLTECQQNLQKINNKFEELLSKNAEELLPALRTINSRFEAAKNISDICTIFSITDAGIKPKVPNKNKESFCTYGNNIICGRIAKRRKSPKEEIKNEIYLSEIHTMLND